jgi:acyl-CoA thioester hydrolase
MDAFGHVNNVVWADYLQEARNDLFRELGLPDLVVVVIAHQRLHYLAPLSFDTLPVLVDVSVSRLGRSSLGLAYEAYRVDADGVRTVYLRADATQVAFDLGRGAPRELTETERSALSPHLVARDVAGQPEQTPQLREEGHDKITVRLSDIDAGGIVSNITYFEFFQEARIGLLTRRLSEHAPSGAGFPPIVIAEQEVTYLAPKIGRAHV